MRTLSDEDVKAIAQALGKALTSERGRLAPDIHWEHHEFVRRLMMQHAHEEALREQRRRDWRKVGIQVKGWAIIGILGFVVFHIGAFAARTFDDLVKRAVDRDSTQEERTP